MMTAIIFTALFVLTVLVPLSGIVTILMFWRNPFLGSMFAALQIVVAAAARISLGNYSINFNCSADMIIIKLQDCELNLSSGGDGFTGYAVLLAALFIYAFAGLSYVLTRRST